MGDFYDDWWQQTYYKVNSIIPGHVHMLRPIYVNNGSLPCKLAATYSVQNSPKFVL